MNNIHKTSIIDKSVKLGKNVTIGPFSIIGPNVIIKNNVKIHSQVNIQGHTIINDGNEIFPFASIGTIPQDLKYHGEKSKLIIGKNNTIREHVTINPGTKGGGLMTGHVRIDDFAIIGGLSAVHQYVRIGKHAMIGGMSGVENDVIPFGSVMGNRAHLSGLNIVGLKRRGFNRKQIHDLRTAFRLIFSIEGTAFERLKDAIKIYKKNKVVMDIVKFIKNKSSSRAICQPKQKNNA